MARVAELHADWLRLVEPVDPFLTLPVLNRVFPEGLDRVSTEARVEMRARLAPLNGDRATQTTWIEWVLGDLLGHGGFVVSGPTLPDSLSLPVPEHRTVLRPDWAVVGPTPESREAVPRLLISRYRTGTAFDAPVDGEPWTATPIDRMTMLCRATGVELGILTDGRVWQLLWARPNEPVGHGTWDATYFSEERAHLDSFVSVLGAKRMYAVPPPDTIEALLAESSDRQEAVTRQLGDQVRAATELLVSAISRANRERSGGLLDGVDPRTVYEAAVTVMMRLVFLLYAEERQLLPLNDETYDRSYAVSTMLRALEEDADTIGEEPLERRSTAWHRLLATFRAVHGGVLHEDLRIPAYGGRLFDPDRFGFLEGRAADEEWRETNRDPLPIDDLTVKAILRALRVLEFREAGVRDVRQLSFATLDVEQIGHVYEGLLDHSAVATDEIVLGLRGRRSKERTSEPEIPLSDVETAAGRGRDALVSWLREATGLTQAQIVKALDSGLDADLERRLLEACENDHAAFERVAPYAHLLRRDLRGLPVVFLDGSVYVTEVSLRRDTGTQYTTRELADEVARYTLEPLVYSPGPAEGADPEDWELKPAEEILALRVCDPAVGSGAILVAACRYLADRVAESWIAEGLAHERAGSDEIADIVLAARRSVAGQCLYGVDRDPMAAEMAKLSLWLVTMAKERPFTFVDHAIQVGDSLLGVTSFDQIRHFHIDATAGRALHSTLFDYTARLEPLVAQAISKRRQLEAIEVVTIRDAEERERLFSEASELLRSLRAIGDLVVGAALSAESSSGVSLDDRLTAASSEVSAALGAGARGVGVSRDLAQLKTRADDWLNLGRPDGALSRECLHWPLAFPEIWADRGRFDALIGNPPFLGGKRISRPYGSDYREYLVKHVAGEKRGNADLCAFFFLRATQLGSRFGFLATNTIAQGDTRQVGLLQLLDSGWSIDRARRSMPWPGGAAVYVSMVWAQSRSWSGPTWLDGEVGARAITSTLEFVGRVSGQPQRLAENLGGALIGSFVHGRGFVLDAEQAASLRSTDAGASDVILPYLSGSDVNQQPDHAASRWVVYFGKSTLAQAERQAPRVLEHLRVHAKPQRDALPDSKSRVREAWWLYEYVAEELIEYAKSAQEIIVVAQTSKTMMPTVVDPRQIISHMVVAFPTDSRSVLGVLSSSLHYLWTERYASKLKNDLRYIPTDCFETFPFPEPRDERVAEIAHQLLQDRLSFMSATSTGMTAVYNAVHDPAADDEAIVGLRRIHKDLDRAVLDAYGWLDLDPDHGFHETTQGVRWTFARNSQTEALDRLLELNHQRYRVSEKAPGGVRQRTPPDPGPQMAMDLGAGSEPD